MTRDDRRGNRGGIVVLALSVAIPSLASAQATPVLPRIAIEDDGSGAALPLLEQASRANIPVAARVVLQGPEPQGEAARVLSEIERRRIPLWMTLPVPSAVSEVDRGWRMALRAEIERRASVLEVLELAVDAQPAAVVAYAAQIAATEARATTARVKLALGGDAMNDSARRDAVYTASLAPYVDLLSVGAAAVRDAGEWLSRIDRTARVVATGPLPSDGREPELTIVDGVVRDFGTSVICRSWRAQAIAPGAIRALVPISALLGHELSALEAEAVDLKLAIGSTDVIGTLSHRLLFDTDTFSTLLVYRGDASPDPLTVSLRIPVEGTPGAIDLLTGERVPLASYARDAATSEARASAPLTGRPMLVNFNEGAAPLGDSSVVAAERLLTVGEIVSLHQRQQLAQDRLVKHYMADAHMRQYFRAQEADAGFDVATDNRYFVADDGIEWEELTFAVNGVRFGEDRPPLPLLQPEKVLSLPLQLRFDEGYRYELDGTDRVDGFDCYRVRFEPVRDDPSLYRGTVWIDRRTFARIRVHARQGDLPGMVVTNEETQRYGPVASIGNQPVFLLSSLDATQNMLFAGRIIRVEKRVSFSEFVVNDDDFVERRAAARLSDRVMFRETPNGLRHYVKREGARVVSDRLSEGAKAMAIGVVLDPTYAFPLPIFGINYVDFSFLDRNSQLAMLFAGVLAAGNVQRPQLGSKRVDASVDFFGIAVPSGERLYGERGEVESERLLTWPLSTGVNLSWRATPFQRFTLQYQLRFDGYVKDTTTAETFVVPSSTITNGIGGNWELNRRGYTLVLNGAWFARASWRPWGSPGPDGSLSSTPGRYAKFSASVSRDIIIDPIQRIHLNAAWFGGRDLDRFAKYQFGIFDSTRIHGIPASVRFGEVALARTSYSVNVFGRYRLDAFLDQAWGRQESNVGEWQSIPGVGVAINVPAPWGTILRADFGKSWLPDRYGDLGSTSLQIMLLKPMR